MSKRMSYFDGSMGMDGFASTAMVAGAALFLFFAIVVGLLKFQATTSDTLDAARQEDRTANGVSGSDILGAPASTAASR